MMLNAAFIYRFNRQCEAIRLRAVRKDILILYQFFHGSLPIQCVL